MTLAARDRLANRVARVAEEGQLFPCPVSPPQEPARPEESDSCGRSVLAHGRVYLLRDGVEFRDLGGQYFAQRDKKRMTKRLLQRLHGLGVDVEVKNAA